MGSWYATGVKSDEEGNGYSTSQCRGSVWFHSCRAFPHGHFNHGTQLSFFQSSVKYSFMQMGSCLWFLWVCSSARHRRMINNVCSIYVAISVVSSFHPRSCKVKFYVPMVRILTLARCETFHQCFLLFITSVWRGFFDTENSCMLNIVCILLDITRLRDVW